MAYRINLKITKSDNNPWFWRDPLNATCQTIFEAVKQSTNTSDLNRILECLSHTVSVTNQELLIQIDSETQTEMQNILLLFMTWRSGSVDMSAEMAEYYTDWTESFTTEEI